MILLSTKKDNDEGNPSLHWLCTIGARNTGNYCCDSNLATKKEEQHQKDRVSQKTLLPRSQANQNYDLQASDYVR